MKAVSWVLICSTKYQIYAYTKLSYTAVVYAHPTLLLSLEGWEWDCFCQLWFRPRAPLKDFLFIFLLKITRGWLAVRMRRLIKMASKGKVSKDAEAAVILQRFNQLRNEQRQIASKIAELDGDKNEHE